MIIIDGDVSKLGRYLNTLLVECLSNGPNFDISQCLKQIKLTLYPIISIMSRNLLRAQVSTVVRRVHLTQKDD